MKVFYTKSGSQYELRTAGHIEVLTRNNEFLGVIQEKNELEVGKPGKFNFYKTDYMAEDWGDFGWLQTSRIVRIEEKNP